MPDIAPPSATTPKAGPAGHGIRQLAGTAILTFGLLIAPDFIFTTLGFPVTAIWRRESVLLALLLALAVTAIARRRTRLIALSGLIFSQLLWFGCIAYFGRALGPEQIMLATTEAGDITSGILDGWRVLMPAFGVMTATGTLLFWLQRRPLDRSILGRAAGVWGLIAVLAGCAGYWVTHKRATVLVPGAQTWSGLGPFQAFVGAIRLTLSPVTAAQGIEVRDQSVAQLEMPDEPVTVMVIMGEGISPTRLSLFGHPEETSPLLKSWLTQPPAGFELIAKTGFSSGVATLGSVPSFIKMAYWPIDGERRGKNLFDLANASGFKSWFLSAQSLHFLDAAGGARNAEQVFAEQGNKALLDARHDDTLVDLVKAIPDTTPRRFIFVHQRVNHSNYLSHCSHLPSDEQKALYIFKPADASNEARRRSAYDNGTRCWDRNVANLVDALGAKTHATYVFITADHNELMGEGGMWGHSMADLRVALVPVLLLTNRPQSDIAERFRSLEPPTGYTLASLVARALGADVTTPGASPSKFYFNNTLPFGQSGYFEVETLGPGKFKMKRYSKEGKLLETKERSIPEAVSASTTRTIPGAR